LCLQATQALPRETRTTLSLDLLLLTFATLVFVLMSVTTPEQCAGLAVKDRGLEKKAELVATVLAAVVSVSQRRDASQPERPGPPGQGGPYGRVFVCSIARFTAQMIFGIQYMWIDYGDSQTPSDLRTESLLHFPGHSAPDLWDFMYYSYTVATCFGTTAVSIRASGIRRLTLLHAIYSFFFVATMSASWSVCSPMRHRDEGHPLAVKHVPDRDRLLVFSSWSRRSTWSSRLGLDYTEAVRRLCNLEFKEPT
jgi:uncharacterized membrane protein